MSFEDLKQGVNEAEASARSYFETSSEYYKLKGFKFLMKGITSLSHMIAVGSILLFALFFLSLAASYGIGLALDNTFYGFLCVGVFYAIVGILIYVFREKINRPLLRKFSEFYFDEHE